MNRVQLSGIAAAIVLFGALLHVNAAAPKKPVYIGSRACGACHSGHAIGNQYSIWLQSKHSRAYASLARPESKEIAKISGLRQDPQEAPICLGCHATAFSAEDWEKDDNFHTEEGVQCEACHGPGSEYATVEVMRDKQAAMAAGLRMPDEKHCLGCHIEKGSHTAVLKNPTVDLKKGRDLIAHPLVRGATMGAIGTGAADETGPGPKYAGSVACGKCHKGEMMGHQFSVWRMGPHSKAWSVLGTKRGQELASAAGLSGDPQKSEQCLKCHAVSAPSMIDEGVGCEACHGPGSEYMSEAVMRDKRAAKAAGLREVNQSTCVQCHKGSHGKPFDVKAAMAAIAHPTKIPSPAAEVRYKTPLNLAIRPDGKELWVTLEAGDGVAVIDRASGKRVAEIPAGGNPTDVAFSPDGSRAFVTNRHDDSVSVIDVASRQVVKTLPTGDEPHGVMTDAAGKYLYVLNTSSDDISVFDAKSLERVKNLSGGRGPWSMALSPDGSQMLVTNVYARFAFRAPFVSEVTAIETGRGIIDDRVVVPGTNLMMGIAWHPSGKFALATMNRTKTLVPMTRLMQGWTITNGLAIIWRDGTVDQVLLDEPDLGFADATDIDFTADGRFALATSSGTDRVAVIDIAKLTSIVEKASKEQRERVLPNHLGYPTEFIVKHIPTGRSPRGIAVRGNRAYVANSLDDDVLVIDTDKMQPAGRISLEGPDSVTKARYGERLFHSANITFRKQFSCHSCHPDGHVDGLTYDIEADGIGVNPVDNRTLRGIVDTAPFKWEGTNPSLQRQCGARLAMFFTRLSPFKADELSAVDYYITTIQRPPNRYRELGAQFSPAQRRGKRIFERTTTADGREIPVNNRCVSCHFPPYYTDRQQVDVGTRHKLDRQGKFDVPHLNNIYDHAPYLHNGIAPTLEEIWTVYNPDDKHGVTNDLTKDQLNDLIEYLKTL